MANKIWIEESDEINLATVNSILKGYPTFILDEFGNMRRIIANIQTIKKENEIRTFALCYLSDKIYSEEHVYKIMQEFIDARSKNG